MASTSICPPPRAGPRCVRCRGVTECTSATRRASRLVDAERFPDRERSGRRPGATGTRLRVAREEIASAPGHVVGQGDRPVRLAAQIPRHTGA